MAIVCMAGVSIMAFSPEAGAAVPPYTPAEQHSSIIGISDAGTGDSTMQMADGSAQECFYNCYKHHSKSYCHGKCGWAPR